MKIDNIEVCKPITELVSFLIDKGFVIIESNVSDYHFHEVIIKMAGDLRLDVSNSELKDISQPKPGVFFCNCHWSCVKIE